jgi:hypothetical protein
VQVLLCNQGILDLKSHQAMAPKRKELNDLEDLRSYTARFFASDLEKLEEISKITKIAPGTLIRICTRALVEAWNKDGRLVIPFKVVPGDEKQE